MEIAHIVPWALVKEHAFDNLIALCPTCHARYDRGEIDRQSMLQYKKHLTILNHRSRGHRDAIGEWELTPELDRLARLEELGRASRARCIQRWQATGLSRNAAANFADAPSVGAPTIVSSLSGEHPVVLLIGPIGSGKSLLGERLLQGAIARARDSTHAPVPVYLEARGAVGQLAKSVEAESDGLGNPHLQGAMVIIDGADEAGTGAAAQLLSGARELTNTWPSTRVVITSRPLPTLDREEEAVLIPELSDVEAYALASRVAGAPVTSVTAFFWPESLKDAIHRPLFALLLGTYLRDRDFRAPRSTGELLNHLVERSLAQPARDLTGAYETLQRLASLSTDRGGGPVPASEVAPRPDVGPLLDSGLVVERDGALSFPLPILTQWFAAHSLAAGVPPIDQIESDPRWIDNWRYALVIAAATFDHEQVSRLLAPVAERYPYVTAGIVREGMARWGLADQIPPPPALDCGRRVRSAMQSWATGIGPLARLIAPVRGDGSILPIGARTHATGLVTAWYQGHENRAEVHPLPPRSPFELAPRGWPALRSANPGRQSAWAWRWTLDELVQALSRLLKERRLPVVEGPLMRECLWQVALQLAGRELRGSDSIPLTVLDKQLDEMPENTVLVGFDRPRCDLRQLRIEVARLRQAGETELRAPWPDPPQYCGEGWAAPFTAEQLVAQAKIVYGAALEGYQQLVQTWFPTLAPRLRVANTLPARLVGEVHPIPPHGLFRGGAGIRYYLDALPRGSQTTIDFSLSDDATDEVWHRSLPAVLDRLCALRPDAAEWIRPTIQSGIPDVFGPSSVRELVYEWLWTDLELVSWVSGQLTTPYR